MDIPARGNSLGRRLPPHGMASSPTATLGSTCFPGKLQHQHQQYTTSSFLGAVRSCAMFRREFVQPKRHPNQNQCALQVIGRCQRRAFHTLERSAQLTARELPALSGDIDGQRSSDAPCKTRLSGSFEMSTPGHNKTGDYLTGCQMAATACLGRSCNNGQGQAKLTARN